MFLYSGILINELIIVPTIARTINLHYVYIPHTVLTPEELSKLPPNDGVGYLY